MKAYQAKWKEQLRLRRRQDGSQSCWRIDVDIPVYEWPYEYDSSGILRAAFLSHQPALPLKSVLPHKDEFCPKSLFPRFESNEKYDLRAETVAIVAGNSILELAALLCRMLCLRE
jgi:hypothetical protein